jgi:hypothetical protein
MPKTRRTKKLEKENFRKEILQVRNAFCHWLDSQDIPPTLAINAMASLIGSVIGRNSETVEEAIGDLEVVKSIITSHAFTIICNREGLPLKRKNEDGTGET